MSFFGATLRLLLTLVVEHVDTEEEEEDSDDGEGETDPDVEEFRAKFRAKQGKKRPNCGGSKRAEG